MVGDPPIGGSLLFMARDPQGYRAPVDGDEESRTKGVVRGKGVSCLGVEGGGSPGTSSGPGGHRYQIQRVSPEDCQELDDPFGSTGPLLADHILPPTPREISRWRRDWSLQ